MADPSTSAPVTLSRYRSQRKAQEASPAEATVPPRPSSQQEPSVDDQVARSKSRYRRHGSLNEPQGSRPITAPAPEHIDVVRRRESRGQAPIKPIVQPNLQRKPSASRYHNSPPSSPTGPLSGATDVEARRVRSGEMNWNEEDERRRRLKERYSTRRSPSPVDLPTEPARLGLFPPQKPQPVRAAASPVILDGPPTSDQIRATRSTSALPKFKDVGEDGDEDPGCFGFLKRKRGEPVPQQAEKPPVSRALRSKKSRETTIKPGGGGAVLGIDAPISAVNTGEREILVECGKSKTIFPVNTTTTTVDIIKSASKLMQERIDVNSTVLIEHFGTVGVQRPLRRYEHIRDVMNSWNNDKENSLLLVDPGTGSSEVELSISGVPRHQPDDDSWVLLYSQKPGKWDKRVLSLSSDGQLTMQKDPKKPQDQVNICHLSDFDIYRPTQEKTRKKIKPPKKFCFAIKSQQKTAMFESTHDFVHFFCTGDRPTADAFYAAVQSWRSWYLVNVMGEGKKARAPRVSSVEKDPETLLVSGKSHRRVKSLEAANAPGAGWPLLDAGQVDKAPVNGRSQIKPISGFTKSSKQFDTTVSPERRTSTAKKQHYPPMSMNNKAQLADDEPLGNLGRKDSVKQQRRPSLDQKRSNSEEFAPTGLLGRNYSQRQKESNERENQRRRPSTSGPNLNGDEPSSRRSLDGVARGQSTRAQHTRKTSGGGGDLQRSSSRAKEMPKPLIDLTPQYREPPQHVKKGRAFNPEAVGPGGLIDSATSPEDPLGIPPSQDWRAGRNANNTTLSRHGTNALSTKSPKTSRETMSAFTGEGLLAGAQAQQGWGGGTIGRGIMDGSRAKGPMLNVSDESKFVQGSLLNKVEREQGPGAPIIDRSRDDD